MTEIDPRTLRSAFGRFMTGVTVVTCRANDGTLCGFTANSFSSVSLDPPLLLVCPGRFLSTFDQFSNCSHFAISILAEGQQEVSNTFASFTGDRFAAVPHTLDLNGIPLIDGAIAQFSCSTWQSLPAGDHQILIGEVQAFTESDALGLGYTGGQYFSLGLERAAMDRNGGTTTCGAIINSNDCVLLELTDDGYRPPQISLSDIGNLRQDLTDALALQGSPVELGPVYSVYDDAQSQTHHVYFLAQSGVQTGQSSLQPIPTATLPTLSYTTSAIADMMQRYALESRTNSFGFYLGNADRGDVHSLIERN
ncbi:flavin reductase family protein [Ruegeria conchae]|uniref:flavin reductase family protein n=1 Tax=Ruegeria conchae TaxID=981384 RepID=UPI0021A569B4|nr:flavin reductase family protein [Ruegeria conchae]UWR04075.1 flavin reductase family protein [Ruegeria conchae]